MCCLRAHRLLFLLKLEKRRDWAERFFGRDPHAGIRIDEDGWLEECMAERVPLAARERLGALGKRVGDMGLYLS